MKWKGKAIAQKAFSVITWICVITALVQGVGLLFYDVYVFPQPLYHLLFAAGCAGFGIEQKNRKTAVLWYVSAVLHVLSAIIIFLK